MKITDGVADISIDYTDAISEADLHALQAHLRGLGAQSVRINTGSVINLKAAEKFGRRAASGETWLGGRVTKIGEDFMGSPIFEIIFDTL